ncbi:MAG: DUF2953 domain-containing protein [Clostridia bacterium]|nr:DUF2953 domain-containing protein [Clostridia bacterium]
MMYLYIILAVILVLLAVIITVPIRLTADYANGSYQLYMKIFGLKFDLSKFASRGKKGKKAKNDNTNPAQQQEADSDKKLMDKISSAYSLVMRIKNVYGSGRHFIVKRLVVENIYVNISFGTFDAALTGIATGAVWSVLYELLGLLTLAATVNNHKFNVDTVYDRSFFDINGGAILKFRIVSAVGILLWLLHNFNKYKE